MNRQLRVRLDAAKRYVESLDTNGMVIGFGVGFFTVYIAGSLVINIVLHR